MQSPPTVAELSAVLAQTVAIQKLTDLRAILDAATRSPVGTNPAATVADLAAVYTVYPA